MDRGARRAARRTGGVGEAPGAALLRGPPASGGPVRPARHAASRQAVEAEARPGLARAGRRISVRQDRRELVPRGRIRGSRPGSAPARVRPVLGRSEVRGSGGGEGPLRGERRHRGRERAGGGAPPRPRRDRLGSRRMDPITSRFDAALENARRFFVGEADVQKALRKLVEVLHHERIPYAIAGALALNAYGYERVTVDVDVLLTREGLADFKAKYLGRGYSEKFKGSRGVRDTEHGVNVDVLVSGEFPGDGKPKPVAFPDPAV